MTEALEVRLRAVGQKPSDADLYQIGLFAKRWGATEVVWVEAWLLGRDADVY